MWKEYKKKPVVIKAIKWTGKNEQEIRDFAGDNIGTIYEDGEIAVKTLEDRKQSFHSASEGDWIIQGVKGEFYPCKPDIFEQTYEEVKPNSSHD